jgi:ornithine cyclodeaminase
LRLARVWSRTPEHARALVEQAGSKYGFAVEVAPSAEVAVRGADIVATVTASPEPVLRRDWLKPGVHINAVGSSIPTTRELDSATVADARLFVDRRESALNEAGDVLIPLREGKITAEHIVAELGEVIVGKAQGRRSAEELTVFKSLGLSVEDVASAAFIAREARRRGVGQTVRM